MKKVLSLLAISLLCGAYAYAQPRAIGIRQGFGTHISYEHSVGDDMLSLEVGTAGYMAAELALTYDFIDPFNATIPWNKKGEWHWYMGIGLGAGYYWPLPGWTQKVYAGVAPRIGIEYNYWFPMQMSLDFRPIIGPGIDFAEAGPAVSYYMMGLYTGAVSFSVRYKF